MPNPLDKLTLGNKHLLLDKYRKNFIDNFWLNLGDVNKIATTNVIGSHELFQENPSLALLDLMRRPEYFAFTCEVLLNFHLHPIQTVILQTLWNHPFSILIATRGGSKCLDENSIIMLSDKICRIRDVVDKNQLDDTRYNINNKIYGEVGYQQIAYAWNSAISPTKQLISSQGYIVNGTLNHPVRALSNNEIVWKELQDIKLNDYVLIDRTESWLDSPESKIEKDEAYLLGLITGDGGYTQKRYISYTTADDELGQAIIRYSQKYFGKAFVKTNVKYDYRLCSVKIRERLFSYYGFNSSVCGEKDFPTCILQGNKENAAAYLQGLFDTDGCVYLSKGQVGFCAKSPHIVYMMQFILSRFGIIANVKPKLNKKYQRYYYHLKIIKSCTKKFYEQIGFRLKIKQDRLINALSKTTNTNIDLIPSTLILPYFLRLKAKYIVGNNFNREWWARDENRCLSTCYYKTYDCSYYKLHLMLERFRVYGANETDPDFAYLSNLYTKNYFFDKITHLKDGLDRTYDFHVSVGNSFISNGFISHNSTLLAIYSLLRALFIPNTKVLFVGSAFRQSKLLFTYAENIYRNAPILKDILSVNTHNRINHNTDMYEFRIEESTITSIPLGDGQKVRGLRSTCTVSDERNSLNDDIYKEVIEGFSSVSINPIEQVKDRARWRARLEIGDINIQEFVEARQQRIYNQQISSGTCGFTFEPLYREFKKYHDIIMSRGNMERLQQIFPDGIPPGLDYRDYAILRLPYELFPENYMDEKTLGKAKATAHMAIYNSEYRCVFISDSNGFFKRTLIEQCTACNTKPPLSKPSCGTVEFNAILRGLPEERYVMAIDPAAQVDNFAIVILGIRPDHRRIRYVWTVNKERHKQKLKYGLTKEHDYYSFCCVKVRELYNCFNCEYIAIDAQGGGGAIIEKLGDPANLSPGQYALYPIVEDDIDKPTDNLPGRHIIHVVQFAKAEWVYNANHNLKQDMETAELIFPIKDSLAFGMAREDDKLHKRIKVDDENPNIEDFCDTLEDCMLEIEELKNELVLIEHRQTPSGRDQWDTPEVKGAGTRKGHLRKDRYSALLMANAIGRTFIPRLMEEPGIDAGGIARNFQKEKTLDKDYSIGFGVQKGVNRRF